MPIISRPSQSSGFLRGGRLSLLNILRFVQVPTQYSRQNTNSGLIEHACVVPRNLANLQAVLYQFTPAELELPIGT